MAARFSNISSQSSTEIDALELHLRTYHSVLKSSSEIRIASLQETHDNARPILHINSGGNKIDIPALIYTSLRLPQCIDKVKAVILGQSPDVFSRAGYADIESWQRVCVLGRRRTTYFDGKDTLAVFITSISDIDDIVNILIAFQEEWNKLNQALRGKSLKEVVSSIDQKDWQKIKTVWNDHYRQRLNNIRKRQLDFSVKLLAGSWVDYSKVTQKWWKNISASVKPALKLSSKSIYFVSSNTHALINLASGFVLKEEEKMAAFIKKDHPELYSRYLEIKKVSQGSQLNDFLYYISKKYLHGHPRIRKQKEQCEEKLGIRRIPALHYLDVEAQVIPVSLLAQGQADPRFEVSKRQKIAQSKSFIINTDYPLGFSAYHVLSEIMENMQAIRGVYISGKASTLNGKIGDILIPKIVYDEHSESTYLLKNCFNNYFARSLMNGSILDNQKAVSVLGTFLQNQSLIDRYSREGITIIEMENGPYLSAVAEATFPRRYSLSQIVTLDEMPFDLGIIDYASDTPYSKAQNLGIRNLSIDGIEPTYFAARSILQRIIEVEENF